MFWDQYSILHAFCNDRWPSRLGGKVAHPISYVRRIEPLDWPGEVQWSGWVHEVHRSNSIPSPVPFTVGGTPGPLILPVTIA